MTALSYLTSSETLSRSFDIALTGATVTFSVLDNELQKILKYSKDDGVLQFRQRAKFVWNENALKDAMDELRGQRDALNLLITVIQSHSISDILALLKAKDTVFQDVKRRTDSLYRPRRNAGLNLDDRWDSYSLSIFSEYTEQKFFDFDSDIMRSPAYARVYSSIRDNQKPRQSLKRRLEPIINLLDEDLIDLHDHPPLIASYSLELEKEMSPGSIERKLSAQQSTPSPDIIENPIENQAVEITNSAPRAEFIKEHNSSRAFTISHIAEEDESRVYTAASVGEEQKFFSDGSHNMKLNEQSADESSINKSKSEKAKIADANIDEAISGVDGTATILENLEQTLLRNSGSAVVQNNLHAIEDTEQNLPDSFRAIPQSTVLRADDSTDSVVALPPLLANPLSRLEFELRGYPRHLSSFIQEAASGDIVSINKRLLPRPSALQSFFTRSGGYIETLSQSDLEQALLYASLNGRDTIAELLLLKGAKVNCQFREKFMICEKLHVDLSPLHIAAMADQRSMIDLLIRCRARVDIKDRLRWTPLHVAAALGCTSALKTLLKHNASIEKSAYLAESAYTTSPSNDLTVAGCTPLFIAATFGVIETARILVDNGANKNVKAEYGLTLVHAVSLPGCTRYARVFREGFTFTSKFRFHKESEIDYVRSIPLLRGHDVRSASPDRALLLDYLIEIGCDLAAPDNYGFTPLHMACLHNSSIVSSLISRTTDVSIKSTLGWTPFHLTALGPNLNLATSLIQAGAEIELTLNPVEEIKPITGTNRVRRAKLFMDSLTPLGLAVAKSNYIMVAHLLKLGASPQMPKNSFRSSVLDIAARISSASDIATRMGGLIMLVLLSKQGVGFYGSQETYKWSQETYKSNKSNKSKKNMAESPNYYKVSSESYLPKSLRVDIDMLDGHQRTTLLRVVQDSSDELEKTMTIQQLLDLGADPKVRYADSKSVLHFSDTLPLDGIRALVKAGADLEAHAHNGITPLLHLLQCDYNDWDEWPRKTEKVQLLIELGANIYAKDGAGRSAWNLLSQLYYKEIASRARSAVYSNPGMCQQFEIKKILNNAKKKSKPPPDWKE